MRDQIKDFYDRTSERFWSPSSPVGRDLHIIPLIKTRGGTFLEYGFGSGSLLFYQVDNFDKVVGYDISSGVIENAQTYRETLPIEIQKKIKFVVSQDDNLEDISSESIDVVVSVATIEHMFDPYKILDEFYRVIKPSGCLIVSVPNYGYLKHRISLLFGRLPKTGTDDPISNWRQCGWDGGHLHTFTKSAFEILLRDTGWHVRQWSGWGNRFSSIRSRYPGILSGEIIAVCVRK